MSINATDALDVIDRALVGMRRILVDLGEQKANVRPALPGANTPFAIVTHCLGVVEFWVGAGVAGRAVTRDRDAEFRAAGAVADLVERVEQARRRVRDDVAGVDLTLPLAAERDHPLLDRPRTRGYALLHAVEELTQHHGQLELTRDVLRNPSVGRLSS